MIRFAQHSTEPDLAPCGSCKQAFAFSFRLPLNRAVVNGSRSFAPGQAALAQSGCVRNVSGLLTMAHLSDGKAGPDGANQGEMHTPVFIKFDQHCLPIDLHHGAWDVMVLLAMPLRRPWR